MDPDLTTENGNNKSMQLKTFEKEFITELFLDCDSVSTMNRLVVAIANVVNENHENVSTFNEIYNEELSNILSDSKKLSVVHPISQKLIGYDEDSNMVHKYDDKEYIARFKMKKSTVEALIIYLKEHDKSTTPNIPLHKKVHIYLWLMTSDSSFSQVGVIFGLPKSSISYIFYDIATLLAEQRYHFISWPSVEEQHVTRIKVNSRYKFPNCVGFIDACRFSIGSRKKRKENLDVIVLQGVCDESLMFIDIHIGPIGQTKKSKVFRDSSLSRELKNFVEFENHILGDSEYKLKKNLITPFSSEELLTSEEMKFNEVHWKARNYIGNAFEKLKERFIKLNHIDVSKPEAVNTLICSACVLQNFILLHEGSTDVKEELILCDDGVTIDTNIVKTSIEKRQFLCNYINYIDIENNSFPSVLDAL